MKDVSEKKLEKNHAFYVAQLFLENRVVYEKTWGEKIL
jgi:hypothetical protein